jgi:ppGpp synthetase/RelA/SpoT-type nucleotidyltranferase
VSDIEQARLLWIQERSRYEAFGNLLGNRIKSALKPLGIWFEVTARAKEVDSLVKKLIRKPEHTFETLPDKVGVRIVIRYRSDLQRVVERIGMYLETRNQDDKIKGLGTEKMGYQSVHLDGVVLQSSDPSAVEYPPVLFWAELQVRTLAQHLWAEMSHDSVWKNDAMISKLSDEVKRRVNLMSGQIEVADREFDRLNSELTSSDAALGLWHTLERHYYTLASRQPDVELSMQVLRTFLPSVKGDIQDFTNQVNDFLSAKHDVLKSIYAQATESGLANTTSFLFQPEVLLLYEMLSSDLDKTREVWIKNYPEPELERIANAFGISLD